MNGGRYEPARLMSVATGIRTYYAAVPKNSTYRVIMSTGLTFSGAAAQAASGASPTAALPVSTGSTNVTIDLGVVLPRFGARLDLAEFLHSQATPNTATFWGQRIDNA